MSKKLVNQLKKLANSRICQEEIRQQFLDRLKNDHLTRDQGEPTHLTLFIMAIDVSLGMVYLGRHKKSGRWLPSGGHVDKGETIEQTLEREICEEWGMQIKENKIGKPVLLTITEIENPKKWKICRRHYDIWYFVKVNQENFQVDPKIIHDEFYEVRWLDLAEAQRLAGNTPNVLEALELAKNKYLC